MALTGGIAAQARLVADIGIASVVFARGSIFIVADLEGALSSDVALAAAVQVGADLRGPLTIVGTVEIPADGTCRLQLREPEPHWYIRAVGSS